MLSTLVKLLIAAGPLVVWYSLSSGPALKVDLHTTTPTMTFSEPQNPKLGIYASPAEWRERLESLPDLQASGGKIPSFYCEQNLSSRMS
jgi:hypothetical protein